MFRRGPGLARTVARTAVVAGTASVVAGGVQHHQQQKYANQAAAQDAEMAAQQAAAQQAAPAAAADPNDPSAQIAKLADLHASGAITDDEFAAAKARILGI